jgi:hypothetical protein
MILIISILKQTKVFSASSCDRKFLPVIPDLYCDGRFLPVTGIFLPEINTLRFHYNKEVLTIPEEGEKANMMAEVLGKHRKLEVNTHPPAKPKQLKARQWVRLKSGLYGWKVKAAKAKSSSTNNCPAPNSAKQRTIVTTQTNPIQKISNYFNKSIHTSDIVAGNDGKINWIISF